MWYIKSQPTKNGNYGTPQSTQAEGMLTLPNNLLHDYLDTMGFAELTTDDGAVTAVTVNQSALDAYMGQHSETPDTDPTPQPTAYDRLEAQILYTAMMTDTLLED